MARRSARAWLDRLVATISGFLVVHPAGLVPLFPFRASSPYARSRQRSGADEPEAGDGAAVRVLSVRHSALDQHGKVIADNALGIADEPYVPRRASRRCGSRRGLTLAAYAAARRRFARAFVDRAALGLDRADPARPALPARLSACRACALSACREHAGEHAHHLHDGAGPARSPGTCPIMPSTTPIRQCRSTSCRASMTSSATI